MDKTIIKTLGFDMNVIGVSPLQNNKNSYFDYNLFNRAFPFKESIDIKVKK